MNPIDSALQMLFGGKTGGQTTGLPYYIKSPIPQQTTVSHPQDFSMLQNFLGNAISPLLKSFNTVSPGIPAQSQASGVKQAMQTLTPPTNSPTPTPTQSPVPFSDFKTAKVPSDLSGLIYNSATHAGVDPNVFASLLFSEHGFKTDAGINRNTNGSYDRGIAQLNSAAHPEVSDQQAIDPSFAIPYAANLLGKHLQDFGGDYTKAVASYNIGEGGVGNPQTFNTAGQAYLKKVKGGLTPQLIKRLGL